MPLVEKLDEIPSRYFPLDTRGRQGVLRWPNERSDLIGSSMLS